MRLLYGTGNAAKLASMRRSLQGLPFEIVGLAQAAEEKGFLLPEVEENGVTPLENARLKAEAYYHLFQMPVFSCDSGLYLWNHKTGKMLPEEVQPGIHVRGRGGKRFSDEELVDYYTGLAKQYGSVRARYKNAIYLIMNDEFKRECEEEILWGRPFLLAEKPHEKRIQGFPLDSISLEVNSGRYFYDIENDAQDELAADIGFRNFFKEVAGMLKLC